MSDVSDTLTSYLRRFSLWCRAGFADRLPSQAALPGLFIQSTDNPAGTIPTVWIITVPQTGANAGKLVVTQQPLGGGYP